MAPPKTVRPKTVRTFHQDYQQACAAGAAYFVGPSGVCQLLPADASGAGGICVPQRQPRAAAAPIRQSVSDDLARAASAAVFRALAVDCGAVVMSFAGISIPALVSSALQCAAGSETFNKTIGW